MDKDGHNETVYCEYYGKEVEIKVRYVHEQGKKIPMTTACSAANTTIIKDQCEYKYGDKCMLNK